MKTGSNYVHPGNICLIVLLIFHNCSIYHSPNVTLEEAVKTESPVRITKADGKKQKFSKIILTDRNEYYGMNKKKVDGAYIGNYVLIEENTLVKTQLKNRTGSTIISILTPLVILSGILALGIYTAY